MDEIWKDIKGYEGLYQVSNLGRIKRLKGYRCKTERILSSSKGAHGYRRISLSKDGIRPTFLVHRLVAEAFLPNPDNLSTVNHKDEDKTNNRVDNLEWMSCKENINYGTGIQRRADKRSFAVNQYTLDGVFIRQWNSAEEASKVLNINRRNICALCNNQKWMKSVGGFIWRYA